MRSLRQHASSAHQWPELPGDGSLGWRTLPHLSQLLSSPCAPYGGAVALHALRVCYMWLLFSAWMPALCQELGIRNPVAGLKASVCSCQSAGTEQGPGLGGKRQLLAAILSCASPEDDPSTSFQVCSLDLSAVMALFAQFCNTAHGAWLSCCSTCCAPAAISECAMQCNKLFDGAIFGTVQAFPCCHLCGHGHLGAAVCLYRRSQPWCAAEPWGRGSHLLRHVYTVSDVTTLNGSSLTILFTLFLNAAWAFSNSRLFRLSARGDECCSRKHPCVTFKAAACV